MLRVQNSGPRFIKDYEGHKLLGAGAFGAVIRVKNRLDKKMYAIKITSDGGFGIDVIREVENLGKIPFHKNVVGYMTSWVDTLSRPEIQFLASLENSSSSKFKSVLDSNRLRVLCIQMELCGEDLRDWLSRHPSVSESRCTDIFRQISNGVQHIHKHNLIHRDLKPDNVFFGFNDRNTIKIGDFGIAASHNGTLAASHTGKFGTLIYLAPEQNTTTYGKKVDLYALGLILFELFYPPAQNRLAESFNKIKFDKELPQTIKQNWPHVSNLILGLTSSDPNKRPTFDIIFDTLDGRSTGQSNISGSSRISRGVKYSSVIHEHVICDGCLATPIRGIRYKCSVCTNYDLCEKCKAKPGIHPLTHSMIKITEKSRTNEDVRDSLIIHEHVGCNVCLAKPIRGIRYKCSVCSNYDLCEKCEAKPGIHPSTHSMIKMKVPKKYSVSNQISRGLNYSKNDSGFYNYDYYYDDDDDEDLRSNLARLSLGASRIARNRDGDKVRKGKPGGSGGDTGLNSSRLYYCGRRKYECRCGCCDGRCGPNNGCPCDACLELVM